jgi:hypothetical protein
MKWDYNNGNFDVFLNSHMWENNGSYNLQFKCSQCGLMARTDPLTRKQYISMADGVDAYFLSFICSCDELIMRSVLL